MYSFLQSSGKIQPPATSSDIVTALGELFDAISELEDEETDLIRLCSPDTGPALLNVVSEHDPLSRKQLPQCYI